MERQADYLAKTKALIPVGDFYSLESARQLVDASTLKERDKTGLKEILEVIYPKKSWFKIGQHTQRLRNQTTSASLQEHKRNE